LARISFGQWEAFFPDGNSYLGQAVLEEAPFEAIVLLLRPGDPSDEDRIRHCRLSPFVIF